MIDLPLGQAEDKIRKHENLFVNNKKRRKYANFYFGADRRPQIKWPVPDETPLGKPSTPFATPPNNPPINPFRCISSGKPSNRPFTVDSRTVLKYGTKPRTRFSASFTKSLILFRAAAVALRSRSFCASRLLSAKPSAS